MEQKDEPIKNIEIEYADNVNPDKGREEFIKRQINIWLRNFSKSINDRNGKIVAHIKEGIEYHVYPDNMSKDFNDEILKYMEGFRIPDNGRM